MFPSFALKSFSTELSVLRGCTATAYANSTKAGQFFRIHDAVQIVVNIDESVGP
jgi:hypothetical protein